VDSASTFVVLTENNPHLKAHHKAVTRLLARRARISPTKTVNAQSRAKGI
jgi:hypothetical protein